MPSAARVLTQVWSLKQKLSLFCLHFPFVNLKRKEWIAGLRLVSVIWRTIKFSIWHSCHALAERVTECMHKVPMRFSLFRNLLALTSTNTWCFTLRFHSSPCKKKNFFLVASVVWRIMIFPCFIFMFWQQFHVSFWFSFQTCCTASSLQLS